MKWETAFRVVAHELRSPAGVISGYTRLLKSGRLDADAETSALTQIDRASGRLEDLGQAASDLSRWLEPRVGLPKQVFDICALVEKACGLTTATDRVRVVHGPGVCPWQIRTDEPEALVSALTAVINATLREVQIPKGPMQVGVFRADRNDSVDVVMAPYEFDPALAHRHDSARAFSLLESGGLGLQVVLGSVVLEAHGGEWWTSTDESGMNGVRLPIESLAHG